MKKKRESFIDKMKNNSFLFTELVKRDFLQKYKRSSLGILWSLLNPLLNLLVMSLVFKEFFGRTTAHYTIYLFSGNIVMAFFRESTKGGMSSLMSNARIFTTINVPKYLFLLSKEVSAAIDFMLTLVVYFIFVALDGIPFSFRFLTLIFPVVCLFLMCIGIGMILSALYVFFRDTEYLYDVFLTLLNYLSAIFYTVDRFSPEAQRMFLCNPVYVYIKFFRMVVIDGKIPGLKYLALCMIFPAFFLAIGCIVYKKWNTRFLYYV